MSASGALFYEPWNIVDLDEGEDDPMGMIDVVWDTDSDPSNPGWYVTVYEKDKRYVPELYEDTDSMKSSFPVDVESFDEDQRDELIKALREHYPSDRYELVEKRD